MNSVFKEREKKLVVSFWKEVERKEEEEEEGREKEVQK
jgi:hypothetical protein